MDNFSTGINSAVVVISWWSNCLGLTCLHYLVEHTQQREIYVVQAGKSAEQKARFSRRLPPGVHELHYANNLPGEHCRIVETVARNLLNHCNGLWFFDHDAFILDDLESWLAQIDKHLEATACCLAHRQQTGPALTSPIFWLSPTRFPVGMPGFEPIPFKATKTALRPDLFRAPAELSMPEKDTLVAAREFLLARNMVYEFPLQSFPRHTHLGGLYMFAGEILPPSFNQWMRERVEKFTAFYAGCPPAWVAEEDTVLLHQLQEFQRAVNSKETNYE